MRLTACLCWFDEPVELLERCVRSLAWADDLVAVDGRWEHFGEVDAPALSSDAEAEAIERAAKEAGLQLLLIRQKTVWPAQVAKRDFMAQAALALGADWPFVIDADEYVAAVDPASLRMALMTTDRDVATVMHRRGAPAQQGPRPIRRLYRASTCITVGPAHNGWRTADGRWLNGDTARVPLEEPLDLSSYLEIHHPLGERSRARQRTDELYCSARRRLHLEAWC